MAQGQAPKLAPGTTTLHPPRVVHHENTGWKISVSVVINWDIGKQIFFKGPMEILQHQLKCYQIDSWRRAPEWILPKLIGLRDFSGELLCYSIKQPEGE